MKKFAIALLSLSALSAAAFAANPSGYYSSLHPQSGTLAAAKLFPPTDINITNASSNVIYVVVPNSPINDMVYPKTNDHIRHSTYYGDTYVSLQDPNHNTFWGDNVCRLGQITVYGHPGSYTVNVDRELCN